MTRSFIRWCRRLHKLIPNEWKTQDIRCSWPHQWRHVGLIGRYRHGRLIGWDEAVKCAKCGRETWFRVDKRAQGKASALKWGKATRKQRERQRREFRESVKQIHFRCMMVPEFRAWEQDWWNVDAGAALLRAVDRRGSRFGLSVLAAIQRNTLTGAWMYASNVREPKVKARIRRAIVTSGSLDDAEAEADRWAALKIGGDA